ncbi:MAG: polyphosphate polymerase domain-containing protein [Firmicutes bacterium]|nr:polyphosphate polymerase domain-containing protein [Bacillota bacterium]
MDTQYSFQRYEEKFWLTPNQKQALLDLVSLHIRPDAYPHYTICNIDYDTPDFRLIRASLEKPDSKEKLCCRSYGVPGRNAPVFLELKKKCYGIVCKRRITLPADRMELVLNGLSIQGQQTQIAKEITWFQQLNCAEPSVFLAYDREAYSGVEDPEVRITFDTQLRYRTTELDLRLGDAGTAMLDDDRILIELKLPGVCPL